MEYPWQPGISAPKFYLIGDAKVNFGNAGNGSINYFDNGWGDEYGAVVSGDKYKEVPKEVFIHYNSAAESYTYEGKVVLPQEKILSLFHKYNIDNNNFAHIIVGMAPGGWIRVWFKTINVQIEVLKTQLKGHADDQYKVKDLKKWEKYYFYWQHHGIPYESWANNEKEYYYDMKFVALNKDSKLDISYIASADGWYSSFYSEEPSDNINDISNKGRKSKLPVHLSVSWINKSDSTYYDTNIVMPKSLKKVFEETYVPDKKYTYSNFIVELENDKKHSTVYLKTKDKTIKLLRFKGELSKKGNQDFGDYMYAKEIEYFVP